MKRVAQCALAVVFTALGAQDYAAMVADGETGHLLYMFVSLVLATLFLKSAIGDK